MSRELLLIVLGLLSALVPFIGLPYSWLMIILPVLGVAVAGIAFSLRGRRAPKAYEEGADA